MPTISGGHALQGRIRLYFYRRDAIPTDANQLRGTLRYKGAFGFLAHVHDIQCRNPRRIPRGRKKIDLRGGPETAKYLGATHKSGKHTHQ